MSDTTVFWTLMGALSLFANRVAEGVKRGLKVKFPTISEDWMGLIAIITSFLAALIGALFLNLNVFDVLPANPYTGRVPAIVGIVIVAAVAAFGSEGLHWFLDLLEAGTKRIEAPAQGGFSQKSETTFVAPAQTPQTVSSVTTPVGTATSAPAPTPTPTPDNDPHG